MVKGYRLLIFLLGALLTASCGVARRSPVVQKDSVAVSVKDSVVLRDSVVFVEVPVEQDKETVPAEDSSHLETSVAESDAWVEDGRLHHELRNKRIQIPVPVTLKEKLRTEEKEHIRVLWKEKVVEKELSNWQVLQTMIGKIMLVVIAGYIAIKCYIRIRN